MELLMQMGLVAAGSMVGGLLRWGVSVAFGRLLGSGFPWGTLFINLTASFFLGWFSTMMAERFVQQEGGWLSRDSLHLLIAVGFTGTYSTFSTYEFEANKLLSDGAWPVATIYLIASMVLGLLAVRGGVLLARMW